MENDTIDLSPPWFPQGYEGIVTITQCSIKPNKNVEIQATDSRYGTYKAQLPMWSNEVKDIARQYGIVLATWKGKKLAVSSVVIPWKGEDKIVRRLAAVTD